MEAIVQPNVKRLGRALARADRDETGQTIVLVALMLTALLGFMGLVADFAWYEVGLMRMQRAADAGALAGVVYLPSNVNGAVTAARNEAAKNGYTHLAGGVTVTAGPDPVNDRILKVAVKAPVRTFVARLFGVDSFNGSRDARAEFILPVPMGSPQDYLGIYKLCQTSGTCADVHAAPTAGVGPVLASQGLWLGVITKGGQHGNGDAYSTFYDGGATPNGQYDPNGYSYTVEVPTGAVNGEVYIFDPTFCATGNAGGIQLGTGDHWIAGGGSPNKVTTTFKLWDTNGTPYSTDDDTLWTNPLTFPCQGCTGLNADSGNVFAQQDQVDRSAAYAGTCSPSCNYGAGYNGAGSADCAADPYHNNWWRLASGLVPGIYRVQVQTSDVRNNNTNAENMFGIQVKAIGVTGLRVYGATRMAVYNNIDGALPARFYLAQVGAVHAGKTLEIRLFDPGDVGGNARLYIEKPTVGGYLDTTFSYTASGGGTGTNVTYIQTATTGSGSLFNNQWITIQIPLPANYNAPLPSGEPSGQPGWWKVRYEISADGNDTTTWEVNIRGNPVHLIIP